MTKTHYVKNRREYSHLVVPEGGGYGPVVREGNEAPPNKEKTMIVNLEPRTLTRNAIACIGAAATHLNVSYRRRPFGGAAIESRLALTSVILKLTSMRAHVLETVAEVTAIRAILRMAHDLANSPLSPVIESSSDVVSEMEGLVTRFQVTRPVPVKNAALAA